jgi:hypothetical protein
MSLIYGLAQNTSNIILINNTVVYLRHSITLWIATDLATHSRVCVSFPELTIILERRNSKVSIKGRFVVKELAQVNKNYVHVRQEPSPICIV